VSFGQSQAWGWWCVTNPFDCARFQREADAAISAAQAGNKRPAELFLSAWQEQADENEATGLAIQETLDQLRESLREGAQTAGALASEIVTAPIATAVKPLLLPAIVVIGFLVAWKA